MSKKEDKIVNKDFDFTPESLVKLVGKDAIIKYLDLKEKSYKKRGRPRLYGEPTKKKTFVIPISKEEQIERLVKAFLKSCETQKE